jgi:hypothetical protein
MDLDSHVTVEEWTCCHGEEQCSSPTWVIYEEAIFLLWNRLYWGGTYSNLSISIIHFIFLLSTSEWLKLFCGIYLIYTRYILSIIWVISVICLVYTLNMEYSRYMIWHSSIIPGIWPIGTYLGRTYLMWLLQNIDPCHVTLYDLNIPGTIDNMASIFKSYRVTWQGSIFCKSHIKYVRQRYVPIGHIPYISLSYQRYILWLWQTWNRKYK